MEFQSLQRLRRHQQDMEEEIRRKQNVARFFRNIYPPDIPWRERLHPGFSYEYLYDRITRDGVEVITRVKWLVAYQEEGVPGPPSNDPLLAITVEPAPGHYFPTTRPRTPGEEWHVTIAKYSALDGKVDLYGPDGVIRYLLDKYEDRRYHLVMVPGSTNDNTGLQLDPKRDPIASDRVLNHLKSLGHFYHVPWHITL
jgi:hypothetical protein